VSVKNDTLRRIATLDEIAQSYDAFFCDVWGVVHNGMRAFDDACAAMSRAVERGQPVILITNAPRPNGPVEVQLAGLGVPPNAWSSVVTSGDVCRALIDAGPRRVFHLGPERDMSLYDGLDIDLCEEFEASTVVCTGLFDDETESPGDYSEMLQRFRSRNLPFVCANPDIVVERGEKLVWCAGALARDYSQLGGRTEIAGKPHRPIYEAALKAAETVAGRSLDRSRILAIGDGIMTDVKGAQQNGFDVLYISGGIHSREYGDTMNPDTAALGEFLAKHASAPVAWMPKLR
jgi:HAD superfamily hydrolase (TIGR01459 family)